MDSRLSNQQVLNCAFLLLCVAAIAPAQQSSVAPPNVQSLYDYGAVCNGMIGAGSMTSSSATFTATSGGFTAADVGDVIVVTGAGSMGADLSTTISAYTDATHVTLTATAGTSVTNTVAMWGTDDQPAMDAAATDLAAAGGGTMWVPQGALVGGLMGLCMHSSTVTVPSGVVVDGPGVLASVDPANGAVKMIDGANSGLQNVQLYSVASVRLTNPESAAVWIKNCTKCFVKTVKITGAGSAGVVVTSGADLSFSDNKVSSTQADGINITNSDGITARVTATGNAFDSTGDDCLSSVSYDTGGHGPQEVTMTGNVCTNGKARGFTDIGSVNVIIMGNVVDRVHAHGIMCAYDASFSTNKPSICRISNNVVTNADVDLTGNYNSITIVQASYVYVNDNTIGSGPGIAFPDTTGPSDHVYILDNHLYNIIEQPAIVGPGGSGGQVSKFVISGNRIDHAAYACILVQYMDTGLVSDNDCEDTDTSGDGSHGVIDFALSDSINGAYNRVGIYGTAYAPIRVDASATNTQVEVFDPNRVWDFVNGQQVYGGGTYISGFRINTDMGIIVTGNNDALCGSGLAACLNLYSGGAALRAAGAASLNGCVTSGTSNVSLQNNGTAMLTAFCNSGNPFISFVSTTFSGLSSVAGTNHLVYCSDCQATSISNLTCAGSGSGAYAFGQAGGFVCLSLTAAGSGLGDPGSNGVVIRTATNTTTARTIAGTSPITVTNGDGVSGNPTIACSTCSAAPGAWSTWSPTINNVGGSISGASTTLARYSLFGKTLNFRVTVAISSCSGSVTGITVTAPVNALDYYSTYSAISVNTSELMLGEWFGVNTFEAILPASTLTCPAVITLSGTYEVS